ncbi:MAG: glycoside hydrolase family 16 protein [Bacteroidales bacterium]|nr:glycoside hydrolase family 16 protein [Bacteroidales bacterium]
MKFRYMIWVSMLAFAIASCAPDDTTYIVNTNVSTGSDDTDDAYYPSTPPRPGQITGGYAPEGYSLVWSDEFEQSASLAREWYFESGGRWANNEVQYYCPKGYFAATDQRTATVSDGTLKITAYKVEPSEASEGRSYISTRMNTRRGFKYGYIEMRARLPLAHGTWPAFWMLPTDGKFDVSNGGGELDIMEWVGNEPDLVWFSAHSQHVTTGTADRYTDPETGVEYPHSTSVRVESPGDWHCYGMEWTHEYVRATFDGIEYFYAPNPIPFGTDVTWWPFDKEYYIKLNLAMGGSWGGEIDPDFTSATYEIDYVRVFQKK